MIPSGARGEEEPAGKTRDLPRFHIMHRPTELSRQDLRPRVETTRKQAAACTDFVGVEYARGRSLGRNHYVELEIKKTKLNGASTQLPLVQKPCEKMAEAIVTDGGKRGQVVKGCTDPACRIQHPNTHSPQQVERERAEERKRIKKEKLAITTPHRILARILQRIPAPLKNPDLLAVT